MHAAEPPVAVLAVDGGNSKIDAVLVAADGAVLGAARGQGASFAPQDHDASVETLVATIAAARADAALDADARPLAAVGAFCLAGDDLPVDDRRLLRSLRALGLAQTVLVRNDTFAVLRAGTERGWGIGVVCGAGMNCCGVAPDGRIVRYAALGEVSGDDGGGGWLGLQAVRAAVRGHDGRDPHTLLEREVPAFLGRRSLLAVLEAIHLGELDDYPTDLAPLVFRCAAEGDAVAQSLLDRQADELVAMITAATRRLRLTRSDVDVVLGGGLIRAGDDGFLARVEQGVTAVVPKATLKPLQAPPVVGAALLAFDQLGGGNAARKRLRRALSHDRMTVTEA